MRCIMKNNYDNSINTNFKGINYNKTVKNMQTFENSIEQALENISKRIQREMPENGSFATIVEKFKNPEADTFARDFSIEISAGIGNELKDIRFVELKTEHPHLDKVRKGAIFSGTTAEVLDFMKEPKKYTKMIKNMFIEDSEKLT